MSIDDSTAVPIQFEQAPPAAPGAAPAGEGAEETPGSGIVRALFIGRVSGGPMERRKNIRLIAGKGIEGDRYAADDRRSGRRKKPKGLALTLIEQEAVHATCIELGIDVDYAITRRNVVTSGVNLDALVGRAFRLGSALVLGVAANPACSRLEKLTGLPGLKNVLAGRGGIRAEILESGLVGEGDHLVVFSKFAGSDARL